MQMKYNKLDEHRILNLSALGKSDKQIALVLGVTENAVRKKKARMRNKILGSTPCSLPPEGAGAKQGGDGDKRPHCLTPYLNPFYSQQEIDFYAE
jgi:hypothetical protein